MKSPHLPELVADAKLLPIHEQAFKNPAVVFKEGERFSIEVLKKVEEMALASER
jgi:hypothetical protein